MFRKVERAASIVAQVLAVAGLILLVAFALGTLADGVLRRFAGRPIDIVRDAGGLVVAVAVACCFPLALLQRANITIKFLRAFVGERAGCYADAVAAGLVEVVLVLVARQFFIYAGQLAQSGSFTTILEIRTAPFWFVVSSVLWIAAGVQAVVFAESVRACRSSRAAA